MDYMLQMSAAIEAAVSNLVSIVNDPAKGLSDAARKQLSSMGAWPSGLVAALPSLMPQLPLLDAAVIWARTAAPSSPSSLEVVQAAPHSSYMQERLLQEFGDLEEVCEHTAKQKQLLSLPVAAMQLLLSSSELKVDSEDNVLYTAQAYLAVQEVLQGDEPRRQLIQQQLVQLIRCPYLSRFWLTAAALATEEQLLQLLAFQLVLPDLNFASEFNSVKSAASVMTTATGRFKELVPEAPSSWLLAPRHRYQHGEQQLPVQISLEVAVNQHSGKGKKVAH